MLLSNAIYHRRLLSGILISLCIGLFVFFGGMAQPGSTLCQPQLSFASASTQNNAPVFTANVQDEIRAVINSEPLPRDIPNWSPWDLAGDIPTEDDRNYHNYFSSCSACQPLGFASPFDSTLLDGFGHHKDLSLTLLASVILLN